MPSLVTLFVLSPLFVLINISEKIALTEATGRSTFEIDALSPIKDFKFSGTSPMDNLEA